MNKNSLSAYRSISMFIDGHEMKIYETLLAKGPLTAWEIAAWSHYFPECCLDSAQIFRRMRDLERAGYVKRMDWVKNSPSGRACSVWWVKC